MIRKGTASKIEQALRAGLAYPYGFYPDVRKKLQSTFTPEEIDCLAVIIRDELDRAPNLDVRSRKPK